jgi:Protein of unknown function (DUF1444)
VPITREQFVNQVLQLVEQKFPLVKISRGDAPFSMSVNGNIASLENVYRMANLRPDQTQRHVERWIVELIRAAEGTPDLHGSFDDLKSRIMPMLITDQPRGDRSPVSQTFIDGLATAYAIDNDRTIAYLTQDRLDAWKVSIDDLHEVALANLIQRSQTLGAHAAQDTDEKIYLIVFQTMDGYDSSRILLPNLHDKLCEHLGSPFAAAIPNRDILLCFRNDPETTDKLIPQIQTDFTQMPHQVSDKILLVTPDGIAWRGDAI